ncbi:alpha/beta fold hydrolase [Nocardia sp. NPDC052566]|uniref:alpha/beta fold hydrolase n=1 Tax=Nocardia sp. NPDC052566 TaxID=3364330 RepID=UPI0037CAB84A
MMETRAISVPGGSIWVSSTGAPRKPAAIMLHHGLAHSRMWAPLMDSVSDELFGIAYDCRCFGRSTTTSEGTYSDTDDLTSVFDAYGVDRAILVGASRGARIAIDFTLTHPDRVRGLFLLAPSISGFDMPIAEDERALFEAIERAEDASDIEAIITHESRLWVDGPTRAPATERDDLRQRVAEMSRTNYAQQRAEDTPDFTPMEPPAAGRLNEITCPVSVLVGEADTLGMRAMAATIERECASAMLTPVTDAAHMLALERPDIVESELRSWLRKH